MRQARCEIIQIAALRTAGPVGAPLAASQIEPRVRAWLETQSAIVEDWLDQLVAANGDERLVGLLHQHAAFLREAAGN